MKGDSMKSYEVYEATLTFNDENEEVNTDNTKNSYSDPELILVFFSLLLLRGQTNRKKSCSANCRHNASSVTFVFVLSRVISKRKALLPWWSPTDKWKIVDGWVVKNMDGKNRHTFCKNLLFWKICILSVPTFILQSIHSVKLCSNYLYWQYFHHFIEKGDSFWPPKVAYPESFNMLLRKWGGCYIRILR